MSAARPGPRAPAQVRPWWRRAAVLLGLTAVLVMGIGLRAVYLMDEVTYGPALAGPLGEAAEHVALGERVAQGTLAGPEFLPAEPLYSLLLGGWARLVGPSLSRLAALQALLGVVILGLTFWLGLRVASAEVGVLGAGLLALYGPMLHFEAQALPVTVTTALLVLALIASTGATARSRPAGGALTGLLFGAVAWARPWLLLVPICRGLGGLGGLWRRAPLERRRLALRTAWVLLGLGVVLTPLYVRNARSGALGDLLPARYGLQLYAASHPAARGAEAPPPGFTAPRQHWFAEAQQRAAGAPDRPAASPAATSRHYAGLALRGLLAAPGAAARRLGERTLRFGHAAELRASSSVAADRATHLALRLAALPFSLLFGLGLLGLVIADLRGRAWLVAALASHLAWALLMGVSSEGRATVAPVLCVAAGAALLQLARELGRRRHRVPLALGVGAATLLLTLLPLDDPRRIAGTDSVIAAKALLRQGRPYSARIALGPAREVRSLDLEVLRVDAGIAQRLGEHREALRRLRQALAGEPRNAALHTALAQSYLTLADRSAARGDRGAGADQLHEALSHLERALALQPTKVDALLLYAKAQRAMGRVERAEGLLRRALAVAPGHAEVHLELAILCIMRGDLTGARAYATLAHIFGATLPSPWDALLRQATSPPRPGPR